MLNRALRDSVDEVLETMFFIRRLGEPEENLSESELAVQLTFEGNPSGTLTLRMTATAARSVAADFLGEEELELSHQQIGDVLRELANMICGSVLSRVESDTTFRLGSPQLVEPEQGSGSMQESASAGQPAQANGEGGQRDPIVHAVEISHGVMVVTVQTEAPECLTAEKLAF